MKDVLNLLKEFWCQPDVEDKKSPFNEYGPFEDEIDDIMPLEDFVEQVKDGLFSDDDGTSYLVVDGEKQKDDIPCTLMALKLARQTYPKSKLEIIWYSK